MSTNYGLELQHRTSPLQIFYSSCSTKLLSLVGIRIGHHVAALKGALPPEQRLHYRAARSKLPGHPEFSLTPGVKFSSVSVTRSPTAKRPCSVLAQMVPRRQHRLPDWPLPNILQQWTCSVPFSIQAGWCAVIEEGLRSTVLAMLDTLAPTNPSRGRLVFNIATGRQS
ncbi:hypothetical protein JOM56_007921 [Amanita muscaria]